jgi:hypothetical protein
MIHAEAIRAERELADALAGRRLPAKLSEWERLVRIAREANLLGTLAARLRDAGTLATVPPAPRAHLAAVEVTSAAQEAAVRREFGELAGALADVGVPVILLKGAAYLAAGLPAARGRMFSDVDILVPKHALPRIESALMLAGFSTTHLHPYDQRYYRKWRHELPPMTHVKRLTTVDVHHTILAEISGVRLDVDALFRDALPLAALPGFQVLAPVDMVLHSAMHLFRNEDFTHGYRDLVDLDALLRHFADDAFWRRLAPRAAALGLGRSLHYALQWTARLFATPVPPHVLAAAAAHAPRAPTRWLMDAILGTALRPQMRDAATRFARRAMYVRGHWLKMPLPLLAWHLTVKAMRRGDEASA